MSAPSHHPPFWRLAVFTVLMHLNYSVKPFLRDLFWGYAFLAAFVLPLVVFLR